MVSAAGGGATETNLYSAAPSALGYLAQVEYALLLSLRRLDDELDFEIGIETLDDIVFHSESDPLDLIQSKHHVTHSASLSNASPEVWKSLNNWIVEAPSDAHLHLMTNTVAGSGSAMSLLRRGAERDVGRAQSILESTARTSESAANRPFYTRFLALSPDERRDLLTRLVVLDGAPSVADLNRSLELAVRKATKAAHRAALLERLRGWWYAKVCAHLTRIAAGERDRILAGELEAQLLSIAQHLRDDDLPLDFYDMPPPSESAVADDERVFVHQLRLIALSNARIRQCIYDHARAFAQRSKWEREKLVHVGELKEFEHRLIEEWRRYCLPETDDVEAAGSDIVEAARSRFLELERSPLPRIRPHVAAEYVGSGSLHMLADRLEIGWHPDWVSRLQELLPDLMIDAEGAA